MTEEWHVYHPFKYVSLFSGIGGFEQALNKLGGTCVMASEIDKYANQAYEVLYGEPTIGDVTKVNENDVPDHDILVGGMPCQAFSVAGKRRGFEDTRGTLFFEIARIAKVKQPKIVWIENVKGLVGHDKGRTLDIIIETLNEIGYRVDFEVLNTKFFGLPQNRERIFLLAVREDLVSNEPWNIEGTNVVAKGKRRISQYEGVKTFNFDWPKQGEVTTRLRDILETKVDDRYYLSEDKTVRLVKQLEERKQTKTDDTEPEKIAGLWGNKQAGSMFDVNKIAPTLKTSSGGYSEPIINEAQSLDAGMKDNATKIRKDDLASTLTASYYKGLCGQGRPHVLETEEVPKWIPKPDDINRTLRTGGKATLSDKHNYDHIAEEVETIPVNKSYGEFKERKDEISTAIDAHYGGFPDNHGQRTGIAEIVKGCSTRTRAYAGQSEQLEVRTDDDMSNTITSVTKDALVLHGEEVRPVLTPDREKKSQNGRRFKDDGDESYTLTAQEPQGVALGIEPKYRIRKLTPLETFRLQGFPDEVHTKLVEAGISNTQLYKMTGNAVSVPVIEALGARLLPYLT